MSQFAIGPHIKAEIDRQCLSTVWLAHKLGCDRSTVYKLYRRTSIDTNLLLKISVILRRDFFALYSRRLQF